MATKDAGQGIKENIRPIIIGVMAGIAVCMALWLLFAVIVWTQNVPQSLIEPMAIVSISAGGLAAGFVCARIMRSGGLMYGLIVGAMLSIIMMLIGLGISNNSVGMPELFKTVFIVLSAAIGGVLGVNRGTRRSAPKPSKKSRRRR